MYYFTLTINNHELKIINKNDKWYLDLKGTLKILGKPFEWWQTLTPSKIKRLKQQGFSGNTQPYPIQTPDLKLKP